MSVALEFYKIDLPDGEYAGRWSAYTIQIDGRPGVHLETIDGVRSFDGVSVGGAL